MSLLQMSIASTMNTITQPAAKEEIPEAEYIELSFSDDDYSFLDTEILNAPLPQVSSSTNKRS
jgi:hypothetical protein